MLRRHSSQSSPDEGGRVVSGALAGGGGRCRFLRRRTWLHRALAVPFVSACLGIVALVSLYHWPRVNVPVYYFTVRPAFVWFAMLTPFLLIGVFGVRLRWFVCGCLLWVIGFAATEEVLQCAKPFSGRARDKFSAARMGFLSYMAQTATEDHYLNVPLRVITWNVSGGSMGAEEAVEQLESLEPDLVFMQEFASWRFKEAMERCGRFDGYYLEGGSEAVLSRFPVTRLPNGPLDERRGTIWRIEIAPGVNIVCVNVHLSPLAVKTQLIRGWRWRRLKGAITRTRQELEELRAELDLYAKEGPIILTGDFNLPPHYPDLRRVTAGLKDCFAETGYGWGKTAPAKLPAVRVDLIFVPGDAKVYYASSVPTRYSDHYMTLAEVSVPIGRAGLSAQCLTIRLLTRGTSGWYAVRTQWPQAMGRADATGCVARQRVVQKFSLDRMVEEYLALYSEIYCRKVGARGRKTHAR